MYICYNNWILYTHVHVSILQCTNIDVNVELYMYMYMYIPFHPSIHPFIHLFIPLIYPIHPFKNYSTHIEVLQGLATTVDCLLFPGVLTEDILRGVLVDNPPNERLLLNLQVPDDFTGEQEGDPLPDGL